MLADKIFYSRASYFAYASPWCATKNAALTIGKDLVNTITLYDATFPNTVKIDSIAPTDQAWKYQCGVYGYHHVGFGNYDGSIVKSPVTSRRVRDIAALSASVTLQSAGYSGGEYNVLNEFYLTSQAGNPAAKVVEIGYLLHAPVETVNFARGGRGLGTHVDASGRSWSVYMVDKFVMVLPTSGADVTSAVLDVKGLLDFLRGKGVITGDEWFNGMAIGLEPFRGASSLTISEWQVTYN